MSNKETLRRLLGDNETAGSKVGVDILKQLISGRPSHPLDQPRVELPPREFFHPGNDT